MAPLTATRVHGTVRPPGDKSISHRALILSALAHGTSRIADLLHSADIESTAEVLRRLGYAVPPLSNRMTIVGGVERPRSGATLDCGNSGTTARLVAGVAAGSAGIEALFTGDDSLRRRPMGRIADPLRAMGATIVLDAGGGLPMRVQGASLRPIEWSAPIASAQVKSAILLAALQSGVTARITEPARSRDHTERMMRARGVSLSVGDTAIALDANQSLDPLDMSVPADPSSAAFFVALALLADDGELRIRDVCLNATRTGFLDVLRRMGAALEIEDEREEGGETLGTIVARPSVLRGTTVLPMEIPSLIDELPMLACVAARAQGETAVSGAGELRVKESDRITMVVQNLRAIGVEAEERPDGFVVTGSDRPLTGDVRTEGDHRIAMAFGVLGALRGSDVRIDDRECARVSYPGFWKDLAQVLG